MGAAEADGCRLAQQRAGLSAVRSLSPGAAGQDVRQADLCQTGRQCQVQRRHTAVGGERGARPIRDVTPLQTELLEGAAGSEQLLNAWRRAASAVSVTSQTTRTAYRTLHAATPHTKHQATRQRQ